VRTVTLVDHSRRVEIPGQGLVPRTLVTTVRYPAAGTPTAGDLPRAVPARAAGPFPLIVFGHGFAVTPKIYARLLRSWARAGYVVAAPVFPLGNADAPGGPNENDLVNQPRDMSFVISQLTAAARPPASFLQGLIDAHEIAVSGQSDGGDTALAAAYNAHDFDRRIGAAVILSGAEIPGLGGFDFPAGGPPLLATQGTADTINPPSATTKFFAVARRPKFLLWLIGARHLGPYTSQQPQLGIVERVSIAFLDHFLKGERGALGRMVSAGTVPGVSHMIKHP
jgi:dienelactone hydrolase